MKVLFEMLALYLFLVLLATIIAAAILNNATPFSWTQQVRATVLIVPLVVSVVGHVLYKIGD